MQISNSWTKNYSVRSSEDHLVFMGQSSLTAGVETILVQLKSRYTKKTKARTSTQYALSDLFKRTFTPLPSLDFCQVSVQSLSHIWLFATPIDCSTQGFPVHHQLPELAQTHVHWVSDAIQLYRTFLLLLSIFLRIRVFSNESVLCIRWPKHWSSSFSISPSNEYWGLISFRIDWFDLLAVQGTPESSPTPQFKSINFSVLSFLYGPTFTSIHDYWKTHSFD